VTRCQFTLEVGDPVPDIAFAATLHGTTSPPEDLTFVSWFARESPSSAVNGWYTFVNTYMSGAVFPPLNTFLSGVLVMVLVMETIGAISQRKHPRKVYR
jgi:hypothetical protein